MNLIAKDLINYIEDFAPLELQEDWDNCGLQIGDVNKEVTNVLITMDLSDKAVDYAIENKVNFIISHHPLFFQGLKSIDFSTYKGTLIKRLIDNNILVYSAHTNLDKTTGGVNFALAEKFETTTIDNISNYFEDEIGVVATIDTLDFNSFKEKVEKTFNDKKISFYGQKPDEVSRLAFIGGSGAYGIKVAKALECDVLVTGDAKHHDGQAAYENNLLLVDLGHYYSEYPALEMLKEKIKEDFSIEPFIFGPNFYYRIRNK